MKVFSNIRNLQPTSSKIILSVNGPVRYRIITAE